jgi:hypothetical protein
MQKCPLCQQERCEPFVTVQGRSYFRCGVCQLRFMAAGHRPDPAAELAHYRRHENRPDDPRYRAFLSRLSDVLLPHLPPAADGLDYGAGPGPTLSLMLAEHGFAMRIYDPFFAPDEAVLQRQYDFITCTETVEHFHRPAEEFARLAGLLRPGGWLGVMTEMQSDDDRFLNWWYARDPTHVCFYRRQTMEWIANHWNWRVLHPRKNVTLFQAQRPPG